MLLVAAIAFGTPGPLRAQSFHDATVSARVTYRIAHDRVDDGDEDITPSISNGRLTVTSNGVRRVIDLARIFAIRDARIIFGEHLPTGGCDIAETFAHRSHYPAVEAIVAEKGCAPIVSLVDLTNGDVVEDVAVDHLTDYRFDPELPHFASDSYTVRKIEHLELHGSSFASAGPAKIVIWPYVVVHAVDGHGKAFAFAFDPQPIVTDIPESAMDGLPSLGSQISVGNIRARPSMHFIALFDGERVLRFGAVDEGRYAARLTPPTVDRERMIRRNAWFMASDMAADDGDFDKAVAAFSGMLKFEDDGRLYADESATLRACKQLQRRVHAGSLDARTAAATISSGCKLPASKH